MLCLRQAEEIPSTNAIVRSMGASSAVIKMETGSTFFVCGKILIFIC